MKQIQLIINIPDGKYLYAKNLVDSFNESNPVVLAIGNGVPLKKELDKINAEVEEQEKWLMNVGYTPYNVDMALNAIKLRLQKVGK